MKKVEICNPYPALKMNRALFGKMTVNRFSFVFSGSLAAFLMWGCSTVICLVNDKVTAQPVTTTTGYSSADNATTNVLGDITPTTACSADPRHCTVFCKICDDYFQDQTMTCLSFLFEHKCLYPFNNGIESLNNTDWCVWDKVNSLYSSLSQCTEEISDCLLIPWPNSLVEEIFVSIHSKFFQECSMEEFSDPPPPIVFALVITPICLIPVMVSLVVLKTKNGDGNP